MTIADELRRKQQNLIEDWTKNSVSNPAANLQLPLDELRKLACFEAAIHCTQHKNFDYNLVVAKQLHEWLREKDSAV